MENPSARQGDASQAAAIAFLSNPDSFEPPVDDVTRIDTHGAILFLAGDRAYKMKRAVAYSYLDFSTLKKRHKICVHELQRNKAAAPGIYIDVVPIVRTESGVISFDKPGTPIEWVVRMARFDQALLFDHMAERGMLHRDHMIALANAVAEYHDRARCDPSFDFDSHLTKIITTTVTSLAKASDLLGLDTVRSYANAVVSTHNGAGPLLRTRAKDGFVRLCHGDLHLQNIVLFDGRPTLFDAIEFDDDIATTDVLFDLAFVLMDLWRRDLKMQANVLFNEYLNSPTVVEDLKGLALFPLFMGLRASIRAMVILDQLKFIGSTEKRDAAEREIQHYLSLSASFLRPETPKLIAIGGRSGSGKTTLATEVAPYIGGAPGAVHVRSDIERKRLFNVAYEDRLGADTYTPEVSETVYRRTFEKARNALKAGHSVLIDAVFLAPEHRELVEQMALDTGVDFIGIWLEAASDTLVERVAMREHDASDADASVVRAQLALDPGLMSWHTVCADRAFEKTVQSVAKILGLQAEGLKQLS